MFVLSYCVRCLSYTFPLLHCLYINIYIYLYTYVFLIKARNLYSKRTGFYIDETHRHISSDEYQGWLKDTMHNIERNDHDSILVGDINAKACEWGSPNTN